MPVIEAPSDQEVLEAIRGDCGRDIVELSRRPYRYATSAALEELRVRLADGGERAFILKDLSRDRLLHDARASKPEFLHEPLRELETVRRILAPAEIGPRWVAAVADGERHWIVMEKVPGVELWQVGDLAVWEAVARWLGSLHARFAGRADELRAANPHLLDHSREWFESWCERAKAALGRSGDPRAGELVRALQGYDAVAAALAALPRTFVHGELYPSNVMVVADRDPPRVCPVDWEMAATGPGLVDLAALAGGYGAPERERLVAAYLDGLGDGTTPERVDADLRRCGLHLALQWLGWSRDWSPPREHAHDWLGEALALCRELELA